MNRALDWLNSVSHRHPWRIVAISVLVAIVAGSMSSRLGFRGDFTELLPVSTSEVNTARTPTPRRGEGKPATVEPAAPAPGEGDEAYWRGEARRLRERVDALKETIARLEGEVTKLEADFYSWDDGAYRDRVIKPAWDKAREELTTARKELPVAERELEDLPDRARKAGALPGWLRE